MLGKHAERRARVQSLGVGNDTVHIEDKSQAGRSHADYLSRARSESKTSRKAIR